MSKVTELKSERLVLRQWRDEDFPLFAKINADPDVMEFYPNTLTEVESNILGRKIEAWINERGWGFWAVELIEKQKFIGFVGLHKPTYELPVSPCFEIGWRLAKAFWGQGYASEAASMATIFAFKNLNLKELYSFTPVNNQRSRAVMECIGMKKTEKYFEHPMIPEHHLLRKHVLYKVSKEEWNEKVNN